MCGKQQVITEAVGWKQDGRESVPTECAKDRDLH